MIRVLGGLRPKLLRSEVALKAIRSADCDFLDHPLNSLMSLLVIFTYSLN